MAKAKSTSGTTRLVFSNGTTVSVSSEKAERLLAAGFSEAKAASTTKTDDSK